MNVYFSKENISIQNNVISFDFLRKFLKLRKNYDFINIHYPWPFADLICALFTSNKDNIIVSYHADIVNNSFLRSIYYFFLKYFNTRVKLINISSKLMLRIQNVKIYFQKNYLFKHLDILITK